MSLLRIRASLADAPVHCQWALVNDAREPLAGEGTLAQLPRRAERVQLVIPAAQVLITRARLPRAARRHAGSVLAYAVEDETVGEPDSGQVSWLGAAGDADILAVIDRQGLKRWLDALDGAAIRSPEVHCETLLLPWVAGEWSLAWDGREGIVRSGELEGAATDCGDRESPPLSLRLMLDEAQARGERPASIALHISAPHSAPDLDAWQRELGVALRLAGPWDWRTASPQAGTSLAQQRRRWRVAPGALARLRPAAWIVGAALAIQAVALVTDWTLLAREQRSLRTNMVARFRATFPDAVAVVDPALQMRRKLAQARHAAGQSDRSDFLPMLEQVAAAAKELPAGAVRAVSYEDGRMTLELAALDEASVHRVVARLVQSGLSVESSRAATGAAGATIVLTMRTS
ncbi:MAG TPA: type II secretion system protein GspL [Burkholderiales bacterium]|nr:type II secretion system protein GspL [Burkholderiales bacterium]